MGNDLATVVGQCEGVPAIAPLSRRDQRWSVSFRARLAPILVGSVLIGAGFLKGYHLWVEPESQSGFLRSAPFQLTLIEMEMALGLALLLRVTPNLFRYVALALFSAFWGINLFNALGGASSCACFGFDIHPWFTVALDLGFVWLLWNWRPSSGNGRAALLALLVMVSASGLVIPFAWSFRDFRQGIQTPEALDEGTLTQGQSRRFEFSFQNRFDRTIVISQVKASCPCLQAVDLPWHLPAGQETVVPALLDLREEPTFVGNLTINLSGGTAAQPRMFQMEVRTNIVAR